MEHEYSKEWGHGQEYRCGYQGCAYCDPIDITEEREYNKNMERYSFIVDGFLEETGSGYKCFVYDGVEERTKEMRVFRTRGGAEVWGEDECRRLNGNA